DNDPQVLKAVSRLLASAGLKTEASTSTREFLDHYDASVPGCLVLDLAMPGGSGLDLQRSLIDRHVDLPVVFLSGCADVPASVRAMKDGAFDFLTKPGCRRAAAGRGSRDRTRPFAPRQRGARTCLAGAAGQAHAAGTRSPALP